MVSAKHASSNRPQSVSPSYGNGFSQGKRKTLIRVGIKPTTFAWNHNCSTDGTTKETGTGREHWDSYSSLIDYSTDFQCYAVNLVPFPCSYVIIIDDHFGFFLGEGGSWGLGLGLVANLLKKNIEQSKERYLSSSNSVLKKFSQILKRTNHCCLRLCAYFDLVKSN